MSKLWINGALVEKADAKVSPFDHGFLYGDGVWEHLRAYGGKLFRPAEHLELLFKSAESLGITIPLSRDELTAAIEATLKANARTDGYIRVIVTRGPGTIGPDPRKLDPQVIVIAEEYQPFPADLYGHGLHAAAVPVPFESPPPLFPVRTLAQLHVVYAKREALRRGCLEAVMLFATEHGHAVGATEGFLFLVKDGAVVVAGEQPVDAVGFAVATLATEAGLTVVEHTVRAHDLRAAEEVFLAGTACGVIGIVRLDGKDIGSGTEGPVTKAVRERFNALTRGG